MLQGDGHGNTTVVKSSLLSKIAERELLPIGWNGIGEIEGVIEPVPEVAVREQVEAEKSD